MFTSLSSFTGIRAPQGGLPKFGKNSETSFVETVFSRAQCRLSGHNLFFLSNKFWNRNCTSLVYFVERNVLQSISIENFHKKSTFFMGCRDLPVWIGESSDTRKLVTLEGWVILPVISHWTMNISANFCRTAKSFGWLHNNFLRFSLKFPCLIAAEQFAYRFGGKINFWSHLGEERPEKPRKFHGLVDPRCNKWNKPLI